MINYDNIGKYFNQIITDYSCTICIKDFCGFVPIFKDLHASIGQYLNHVNPYCMYIKKEKEKYYDCLSMIPKMIKKCITERKTYFGLAHCGIGEFVIPIITKDNVIGAITLGAFTHQNSTVIERIKHVVSTSRTLNIDEAITLYNEIPTIRTQDFKEVITVLEIIADFLASSYSNFSISHNTKELVNHEKKALFVEQALEYINSNFNKKITVMDISKYCNFSVSFISHNFKKSVGLSINNYVNKVRIEVSKSFLLNHSIPISEISELVGFPDPNYFSKVFTTLIGYNPLEFRRRFRTETPLKIV